MSATVKFFITGNKVNTLVEGVGREELLEAAKKMSAGELRWKLFIWSESDLGGFQPEQAATLQELVAGTDFGDQISKDVK